MDRIRLEHLWKVENLTSIRLYDEYHDLVWDSVHIIGLRDLVFNMKEVFFS